jgi:chromosome segregation ATPase
MIDPGELKRNLEALSDALPDLPGRLSALAEASEALEHSVDEVGKDLRDRQAEAEKLFTEVEHALGGLDEAATEEAARLRQGSAELESGLRESLVPLAFEAAVVSEKLHPEAVSSAPDRLRAVQDAAGEAMASVVAKLDSGQAALGAAAEMLTESEAVLVARIDTAQTALTEGVDGVVRLMEARQQDALARIDEMVHAFAGLQSLLKDKLDEVAETVCRFPSEQALEETRNRAEEIRQRIVSALNALEEEVKGVGGAMKNAREGSAGDRESLEPLFQELRAHLEPMKRAIESIREEAEDVGLT